MISREWKRERYTILYVNFIFRDNQFPQFGERVYVKLRGNRAGPLGRDSTLMIITPAEMTYFVHARGKLISVAELIRRFRGNESVPWR